MEKSSAASNLGKLSVKKRFQGKTPEEISKAMSDIRKKGIANKIAQSQPQTA